MNDSDTKTTVPGWLLIGGLISAIASWFAFNQAQRAERVRASADSLREMTGQRVTETVGMDGLMVLAVALFVLASLMLVAYLIGYATRR